MLTFVNTYHSLPSLLVCESELDIRSLLEISYSWHIFTNRCPFKAIYWSNSSSLSLQHTNKLVFASHFKRTIIQYLCKTKVWHIILCCYHLG